MFLKSKTLSVSSFSKCKSVASPKETATKFIWFCQFCFHSLKAVLVSSVGTPSVNKKMIVDWGYNAWGDKYPPYDLDDNIPTLIAKHYNLPVVYPGIVMEGGSVDFNGKGTVLTTTSCLLNPNRNPHLNQKQIEEYLCNYYGVTNILWLGDGIVGDDTDGHIDDITRFVNEDTVVTVVEENISDENHEPLQENLKLLKRMRLESGKQINIVELPMPSAAPRLCPLSAGTRDPCLSPGSRRLECRRS